MPRAVSTVAALVLVAAVGIGLWLTRSGPEPVEQTASEQPTPAEPAASPAAPQPPGADASDSAVEPPARLPDIPRPSAEWLQAPSNPMRVTLTAGKRDVQRRITPAGGTINTTTPDGTRVSLVFPPDSLWRSEEITIRAVEELSPSPSAAAAIAVSISPEDLPLRRSPVLQFEPRRVSSASDGGTIVGFAVRRDTELSLYPAVRIGIERAPGRYRYTMALTRLGVYGVTTATDGEITALGAREPSDLGARLEARIALAYVTPAPQSGTASGISTWTLIPRLHAQGGMSVFIYNLLKQLLEYYQQVVIPKFDKLPTGDCLSGAVFDAINTYLQWRASVELLMPMERTGPLDEVFIRLVEQRRTMLQERGYSPSQIDEIDRAIVEFRDSFGRLNADIEARIRTALQVQFGAIYRCCTTQRPLQYHLTAMLKILRFAELNGHSPVDPEPMQKLHECACIVGANQPGAEQRFTGSLSYTQNTSFEKSGQRSSRASVNSETLTFEQASVLTFAAGDHTLTSDVVSGSLSRFGSVTDDHQTCVVHNESQVTVKGNDSDTGQVSIDVNPQYGTYTLSFSRALLDGSGLRRSIWNVKGPGCGPFNKDRDKSTWTSLGISPVAPRTVRGTLNPDRPTELKGTQVFEERDVFYDAIRSATLKWDLQRCER